MRQSANRFRTFMAVTLPLSLPGIIGGFLLAFAIAISAYATPAILGGPATEVMATLIRSFMAVTLDWALGAAMGAILLVSAIGLLLLTRMRTSSINGAFNFLVFNVASRTYRHARLPVMVAMKDDSPDAGAYRIRLVTPQSGLVAVLGLAMLAALAYIASSLASAPDMRSALFLRSVYEDTAGEVVRQYRVALKRQNKEELCVFAGMIASAYAHAHEDSTALAWKDQEGRDCSAAGMESVWGEIESPR